MVRANADGRSLTRHSLLMPYISLAVAVSASKDELQRRQLALGNTVTFFALFYRYRARAPPVP